MPPYIPKSVLTGTHGGVYPQRTEEEAGQF